jgi:hypothetical protein
MEGIPTAENSNDARQLTRADQTILIPKLELGNKGSEPAQPV